MSISTSRRADGWAVAFALVWPALATWIYFVVLARSAPALQQSAWLVGKVVQFAFPLIWVLGIQRRRIRWKRPRVAGVVEGAVFGAAIFALMLAAYYLWLGPSGYLAPAGEAIAQKVTGFGIRGLPAYVALGCFYSIVHSFLEEYYWRWFAFGQLRRLIPWKTAVVLSSLGFMAHHVIVLSAYFGWFSLAAIAFSLAVAVGGAIWAWLYQRSDSLYGPWLSHVLVDAAIFVVGYTMIASNWAGL